MNAYAETNSRKYTRRSEAQWRELINNFEHSDLTLEAYCQRHKIASSGFYTVTVHPQTSLQLNHFIITQVQVGP